MKRISKAVLAVLAAGFVTSAFTCQQAQAIMVDGAITFSGGAVFDTMDLSTATRVNTFSAVVVQSRSGDFESFVNDGDVTTMAMPYIFVPSTPTPGLWSVGGFTFDLSGSVVEVQTSSFLAISGTGTISGNGFDATPGTWSFTSQSPSANGVFSFSSGSAGVPGVPEGGATVALLGLSLAAVEVIRRKFSTA